MRADENIIRAGDIVHAKRRTAAIGGCQIRERIIRAFRLRRRVVVPRHKHSEMMAVMDRDVVKLISAARAHENAQIIRDQDGITDNIIVKTQIQGDARARIIMQI